MPDTDDTFVSDGGAPEPIVMPTVNASLNVWGALLNVALNLIATTFNYTQGLITAVQAAATALTTRVTTLEGYTPSGFAGAVSGQIYFGATCEGLETETGVMTTSEVIAVPFDYIGTFNSLVFAYNGPGITYDFKVRDSGTDGLPGATLATATYPGTVAGTHVLALSVPVTLRRPAWLTITAFGGQPLTRGTTGKAPARWVLGSTSGAPTAVSQAVTCLTSFSGNAPWAAKTGLSTNNWAPSLALVAS